MRADRNPLNPETSGRLRGVNPVERPTAERPCTVPPPNADRALVSRCLAGDSAAIRSLVEGCQGAVYGLCYRMLRHRQDAEDVTQETFVRALGSLHRWDSERPLLPWLLAIAANRCRTALSRRSRRPVPMESFHELPDHRTLNEREGLEGELERALGLLREEYRMVFVLFHEQGLAYEEISRVLQRPVGTIKTWLHRARAEMVRHLSRRGIVCGGNAE